MRHPVSFSVIVMLTAGLFCGCQSLPGRKGAIPANPSDASAGTPAPAGNPALLPSPIQRFKEVPVPLKAKEDFERSYVFETSGFRIARQVYTSRATVNELAQFYIEECRRAGWTLENVTQTDLATLTFSRPGHNLMVTIRRRGFPLGRRIEVHFTPARS